MPRVDGKWAIAVVCATRAVYLGEVSGSRSRLCSRTTVKFRANYPRERVERPIVNHMPRTGQHVNGKGSHTTTNTHIHAHARARKHRKTKRSEARARKIATSRLFGAHLGARGRSANSLWPWDVLASSWDLSATL